MSAPGPQQTTPEAGPPESAEPARHTDAAAVEQSIADAVAGLDGLDELAVSEHVHRFDAVHSALTDALTSAENLLSGSSGNGG